jgi:hypothetical protein
MVWSGRKWALELRVQFSANAFRGLARSRLQKQLTCIGKATDEQQIDWLEIGYGLQIRPGAQVNMTVPAATGPQTVASHKVELWQPVVVHTTTLTALRQAGPNPSPTVDRPVWVVLDAGVSANGQQLLLNFDRLEPQSDPEVRQAQAAIQGSTSPMPVDLPDVVAALGELAPSGASVLLAALQADVNVVEIRIELGTGAVADPASWAAFLAGSIDDIVGLQDWAVLVDREILKKPIQTRLAAALNTDRFRITSPVSVEFSAPGGSPRLDIGFSGTAISVCTCPFNDGDVDTDVSLVGSFSAEDGQVRIDFAIDHDANDLQLFCCEVTAGLLWPYVGADLFLQGEIPFWLFELGFLTWGVTSAVGTVVGSIIGAQFVTPPIGKLNDPLCTKDDDEHVHCCFAVNLPPLSSDVCRPYLGDSMTVTTVRGNAAGLIVCGTQQVREFDQSRIRSVEVSGFTWRPPNVNCSGLEGELQSVAELLLVWTGDVGPIAGPRGVIEPKLCDVTALGRRRSPFFPDPLQIRTSQQHCPLRVTVDLSAPASANPTASVEVLVRTTAGLRLLTVPPTSEAFDAKAFELSAFAWRAGHCHTKIDPWYREFGRFDLHWLVDPGPKLSRGVEHRVLTHVAFDRLATGDRIRVLDGNRALVEGAAGPDNRLQVPVLVPRRPDAAPLSVERVHTDGPGSSETPVLTAKQVLLRAAGRIDSPGGLVAIVSRGETMALVLSTEEGMESWSLVDTPRHGPRLNMAGIEAAAPFAAGYLVIQAGKLTFVDGAFDSTAPIAPELDRVTALAAGPMCAAVGADDGVHLIGFDGKIIGRIETAGVVDLALVADRLALADRTGVKVYDISEPAAPRASGGIDLADVVSLELVSWLGGEFVARRRHGGVASIRASKDGPQLIWEAAEGSWPAGIAARRGVLAISDAGGYQVFVAGESQTMTSG